MNKRIKIAMIHIIHMKNKTQKSTTFFKFMKQEKYEPSEDKIAEWIEDARREKQRKLDELEEDDNYCYRRDN